MDDRACPRVATSDPATDETRRRQRVGTAVLKAVVEYVSERSGGLLWCNARAPAVAF